MKGENKRRAARLRKFFNVSGDQEIPASKIMRAIKSINRKSQAKTATDFEKQVFNDLISANRALNQSRSGAWGAGAREWEREWNLGDKDAQGPHKDMMEQTEDWRPGRAQGPEMFTSAKSASAYLKEIGVAAVKEDVARVREDVAKARSKPLKRAVESETIKADLAQPPKKKRAKKKPPKKERELTAAEKRSVAKGEAFRQRVLERKRRHTEETGTSSEKLR